MKHLTAQDHAPTIGERMIWVKGGSSSQRNELPLEVVWVVEETDYNYVVIGEDGKRHNVLANRLFYLEAFHAWLIKADKAEQPMIVKTFLHQVIPQDVEALKNMPDEVKAQLSTAFRDRYGI